MGRLEWLSGKPPVSRAGGRAFETWVVCLLALGHDDAVDVTTILLLFDKNEVFCLYRHYIYTQKIYQLKSYILNYIG